MKSKHLFLGILIFAAIIVIFVILYSPPQQPQNCAINGESPTDFDLTTGKTVPDGKPCCTGLKEIGKKTNPDDLAQGACMMQEGVHGTCRPCGNGICNTAFEDKCNCPEDCK